MINVTSNPALKLAFGAASATIAFTTDSTPAIQATGTSAAGSNYFSNMSSVAGFSTGDFISVEGGGLGGTSPWNTVVLTVSAPNMNTILPSARAAVTNAVINRYERIETRYRAKKLTLTNLTNGDVFTWDTSLLDGQAFKNSGGVTTTLTSNGLLNRSNAIGIHPNLLPANSSFTLQCDYDYYS